MGVCLSFRGRQAARALRDAALAWAREFAQEMEWGVQEFRLTRPRAILGQTPLECPEISGLQLLPHFACEVVPLLFLQSTGQLVSSYVHDEGDGQIRLDDEPMVKTQFAGPGVHEEICDFLRELKNRFLPDLQVDDESEFFECREPATLSTSFEAAWEVIAQVAAEQRASAGARFEVGGMPFDGGPPVSAPEFAALSEEQRESLLEVEQWFVSRFSGFGYALDHTRPSVENLDLLMSDIDQEDWADRAEDPEIQAFLHALGAYFGRTVAAVHGGAWKVDDEEGLTLSNVGRSGLRMNPFQIAADRLLGGPAYGFGHHFVLVDELVRHLGT